MNVCDSDIRVLFDYDNFNFINYIISELILHLYHIHQKDFTVTKGFFLKLVDVHF
jgi:hypothetical protein